MMAFDLRSLGVSCRGYKVGYTSGVFDLFHYGHAAYLRECKKLCDLLVVGVDSDAMVTRNKGRNRPIDAQSVRMRNVSDLVDCCFLKEEASIKYIELIKPSYFFFSEDKTLSEEYITAISKTECFVQYYLIPYTEGISTTEILSAGAG
ncbi:adenylyltransferase/cytidyltransferase family protein [Pseudomonas sp. SIMBA_021]|uniref:adenylyltransferase/cytidyltransferase family protein n=1 Tax=unclassified Pseudomonas TaxID=196821 RepID=UPI00397C4F5C